ncbi:hypothetical protein ALC57_14968 [Trachymyrmex cornetzi]|uniref:Uncharacterized protein n=1 Tax=Trachymyrmex cornetzi TaxID=471704 RepID=A0A195DJ36_9HYME|nr:hypothetical protein ALC57_14968 [Trachymyrmex cornetzi]
MTAARLAWHGSGIWTTDDVDRGVTGSETGVPHVGGSNQVCTLRPQAMVRTILSHQRGVYRTEYRYELSDVNHLSETSSEERETDTKKTLTIDPVDELRSTIANPSDQMARSEVFIRDSLENNDILKKASKSREITENKIELCETKGSKAKEFGIVSLPHVVLEEEEAPAVGGSLRKSGGRPSVCGILANGITTGFYNGSIDPPLMRLSRGRGRQHVWFWSLIFSSWRNLSRNNDTSLTLPRRVKKWETVPQIPALVTRPSVLRSSGFLSLSARARERSNQGVEAP